VGAISSRKLRLVIHGYIDVWRERKSTPRSLHHGNLTLQSATVRKHQLQWLDPHETLLSGVTLRSRRKNFQQYRWKTVKLLPMLVSNFFFVSDIGA
jgi:hypothetical protein